MQNLDKMKVNIVLLAFLLSCPMVYMTESCGEVAFSVTLSTPIHNMPRNAIVRYNKVTLNVGDGYNINTGIFTAPYCALYKFDWTSVTNPGSRFITLLMLNGVEKATNHPMGAGGQSWDSATQTIIMRLHKGDRVWVQSRGTDGRYTAGYGYSTFNGHKL